MFTTPNDALATAFHFEIIGFSCLTPNVKTLLLGYCCINFIYTESIFLLSSHTVHPSLFICINFLSVLIFAEFQICM